MMSFTRGSVNKGLRWILLFALAVMVAGLLQLPHLRPVSADDGGYPWADAQCVDGTNCSTTYNWGYTLQNGSCPSKDPNCLSYPYPNGTNPTAGMGDTWGYGVRNCTSYVAWKIKQVFGKDISGWGDAKNWADSTHGYTVDNTPSIRAIAVWQTGGGGHGHVAYVYAVNTVNGVKVASLYEYNSGFPLDSNSHPQWGLFYSGRTTASNSAGTPYRYIHIGTITPPPPPAEVNYILYRSGTYTQAKAGLNTSWTTEYTNASDIQAAGTRLAFRDATSGHIWAKDTLQGVLYDEGTADQYVITPSYLLERSGTYTQAKAGLTDNWTTEYTNASDIKMAGTRLAFRDATSGHIWAKDTLQGILYDEGAADQYVVTTTF